MSRHRYVMQRWLLLGIACALTVPAVAQRAGQSISVQYGVVTGARQVDLQSGAVPGGALVGGALGLASASGKSSGKKARNTIVGMVAGSAIAGASQGSTKGMLYDVNTGGQGMIQIVSDQREVRIGDCVAIEKAGDTANIRRMSASFCDPANAQAVDSVAGQSQREAEECLAAKQQLVEAGSVSAAELAAKKIELLCND